MRPLLACLLVAVGIASIVAHQSVYHGVAASLFQLVAMWLLVKWWEWRERLASLTADVERREVRSHGDDAPVVAAPAFGVTAVPPIPRRTHLP
jgi:hypothetical protein